MAVVGGDVSDCARNHFMRTLPFLAAFCFASSLYAAPDDGWIELFNGKNLDGWAVKCRPGDKRSDRGSVRGRSSRSGRERVAEIAPAIEVIGARLIGCL